MLADEGVHLYRSSSGGVRYIDQVTWDDEDFITTLSRLIVQKGNKKPVLIVNDMVEQHYRKEKLPKVSVMDKKSVVKRRLNVAFPNYPIKAALKMKEQVKGEVGSGTYLFAAIPQSDAYRKTIEAVRRSGAPIVGLYLLPLEGTTMLSALAQKQSKKTKSKADWAIFVGQHHGGGLRQVVIKKGDLALTRMTPVVDTDVEPDVWVKEVTSELQSTMSYLARFGYKQEDGLDIFIIANGDSQPLLESVIDIPCNLHCLNAAEAARVLGIKVGKQEDLRYADALHAAWQGRQLKFVLPMQNKALDQLSRPRQVAFGVTLALSLAAGYVAYDNFTAWTNLAAAEDALERSTDEITALKEEYVELLRDRSLEGYDYLTVDKSIAIHGELEGKKKDLLPVFAALGVGFGPNVTADSISIDLVEPIVDEFAYSRGFDDEDGAAKPSKLVNVEVKLTFSQDVEKDIAVNKVTEMVDYLKQELQDYTIEIEKQVGGVSYSENFVEEIGAPVEQQTEGDNRAIITLKENSPTPSEEAY
ncbi:MAG: hypothetical protein HRT94_02420 [Alphaproteobacteria bacterium]|nr:hypothetical protein [Alphaproteobacteria bacterium]